MKRRFLNIVGVFPDNIDFMVSEAKRLYRECGITEPLLNMTLHPQGGTPYEKLEIHRKVLHEYIEGLKDTPAIRPGVLFQTLLGHRKDCPVTLPGRMAENINHTQSGRMCILSKDFRDFVYHTVQVIAAEHPCQLLVDDDFRQINGRGLECFCEDHLAQYNQGLDRPVTADELRELLKNAKPGDDALMRYEKLRWQNLIDLAQLVRSAIDSVDPSIPCGSCMPGWEYLIEDQLSIAFAGKNPPLIRMGNSNYYEGDAKALPTIARQSAMQREMMPRVKDFIDEADTCPHNRYSKSAKSMHAKLVMAALNREVGAKLWLTNLSTPDTYTERKYDEILAKYKDFYPVLFSTMQEAKPTGFVTPLPEYKDYFKFWHPLHTSDCYIHDDWETECLGQYGIPGCYLPWREDGIRMLTKEILRFYDDDQVRTMLAGKILLSDDAAVELTERGFANLIGVTAELKEFWCSGEKLREEAYTVPYSSLTYGADPRVPYLTPLSPATRILSDLTLSRFSKDPTPRVVGVGSTLFHNELGGTVAVSCRNHGFAGSVPHPRQRHKILKVLEALNGAPLELYVESDQNVYARQFRLPGNATLLAVFNLNFDELEAIDLRGTLPMTSIDILAPDGTWQPAPRTANRVDLELRTYDCVILRIN